MRPFEVIWAREIGRTLRHEAHTRHMDRTEIVDRGATMGMIQDLDGDALPTLQDALAWESLLGVVIDWRGTYDDARRAFLREPLIG